MSIQSSNFGEILKYNRSYNSNLMIHRSALSISQFSLEYPFIFTFQSQQRFGNLSPIEPGLLVMRESVFSSLIPGQINKRKQSSFLLRPLFDQEDLKNSMRPGRVRVLPRGRSHPNHIPFVNIRTHFFRTFDLETFINSQKPESHLYSYHLSVILSLKVLETSSLILYI